MTIPSAAEQRGSSLHNVVDIVIAPSAAFERIRLVPAWGWAYLVASLLGIAGFLLMQPAFMHALETSGPALYAANPAVAKLPPDQQAKAIEQTMSFARLSVKLQWIGFPIGLLISGLITAVLALFAKAVGKGEGSFRHFFALAITLGVVTGLGLVITGLICVMRGAASFDSLGSVTRAMPSLALLAPSAPNKAQAFLAAFSIVTLSVTTLQAYGLVAIARISPAIAWAFSIAGLVISAGLAALFTP
ncbi:hypothetical protein WPS_07430 [Vulcanimicrobium alpinum]|uniref:Yip1 domain-containing protein n=1 Tax=Vulcanimicrobium alpinum TaxID=3016050 RepID=A0AAN1XWA7_UNVUL|nr:hypothetical protein [Vulcanimicrobium alpinum]BDE05467.1 hypothetical protein WPS_07430 [Vulcanimicrobium alpinum]